MSALRLFATLLMAVSLTQGLHAAEAAGAPTSTTIVATAITRERVRFSAADSTLGSGLEPADNARTARPHGRSTGIKLKAVPEQPHTVCAEIGSWTPDQAAEYVVFEAAEAAHKYGLCAGSAPVPKSSSPRIAATQLWWDAEHDLPKPTVWMAPGKAITGLEGCLEIGGPATYSAQHPNVFGMDITLTANSTYDIDWGDGSVTRATTNRGGACDEGGTLRHAYQYVGDKTITVTQHWTASWSAGNGTGGTIADTLETVGTLRLPVFEIQPVLTDPATST